MCNMLLANKKQKVKCACLAFLLALARYRRDSGGGDDLMTESTSTESTLKGQHGAGCDDTVQGCVAPS